MIYEVGAVRKLAEREPVIFEALCLIEGLRRVGVEDSRARGALDLAERTTVLGDSRRDVTVRVVVDAVREGDGKKALTRAGFSDMRAGERAIFVRVHTDVVGQVWNGLVGPCRYEKADFGRRWAEAVETFGKAPVSEAEPLWQASRARARLPDLEQLMRRRGFVG